MRKIYILFAAILILLYAINATSQTSNKITPELLRQMLAFKSGEKISCLVQMKTTYPYESVRNNSVKSKIETFRKIAKTSQEKILALLRSMPPEKAEVKQTYWVMNGFHLIATADVINEMAKRDDVEKIFDDEIVTLPPEEADATKTAPSRAVEWNILKIEADKCWDAGYTGQGIVIGILDTGVEYTHPALTNKWAGYWHVAQGFPQQATPYDDNDHGTHCMGTILGGDGRGSGTNDIGVAPDAKFVAAKILGSNGSGSSNQIIEGMQFMADTKALIDIKAISNSWTSNSGGTYYVAACRTLDSLGIYSVFATGNSGPNASTAGAPADYPNEMGIGNTDDQDDINNSSSRGPSTNSKPPYNDLSQWIRADWNYIKPNISAPGTNINSAKPGGTYWQMTGTSMATPHVCGAVALLCQKNPVLTRTNIYNLLVDNVDLPSQGAPYPNNDYGWGRLNVWKALQATPTANMPWVAMLSRNVDVVTAGQTGNAIFTIKNIGGSDANNTTVKLISKDIYIIVNLGNQNFGTLASTQSANNNSTPFTFTAHQLTPAGHVANMIFIVHADGTPKNYDDTIEFTLTIGTAPPPFPIYSDDFEYVGGADSFPQYWTVTGNWSRITANSHSATHSSYSGAITGGTTVTTYLTLKNAMDLSKYTSAYIDFWHSFDFDADFTATATMETSTNGGTNWVSVWNSSLSGSNKTIPWTKDSASIISLSNNFKVRYVLSANAFFVKKADWWIDDFEIKVPSDVEPPYFDNTTIWVDTPYTGPFIVKSDVTDDNGVDSVRLYYKINGGSWNQLAMAKTTGNTYQATIPAQGINDSIKYYLWAKDKWAQPNKGTVPVGAIQTTDYFKFKIIYVNTPEKQKLVNEIIVYPNPSNNYIDTYIDVLKKSKLEISFYDLTGRKIETIINKEVDSGYYQFRFNEDNNIKPGVYFIHISCTDGLNNTFKTVKKIIIL
ncbi:MAG: S8 family serine peptidase [Bacteroidales bacterium]|nr:S8 family serine peptidase [Bacteroidales bacterium]